MLWIIWMLHTQTVSSFDNRLPRYNCRRLKGTDEEYVPVEGGEYVKEAKIGRAIMDAEILFLLTLRGMRQPDLAEL